MTTATQRLHLLYEVNRRLTTFDDLDELLRYSTQCMRELFEADGCAILLLDRARSEFYFPVASQRASQHVAQTRLAEIRFPSDRGIAGWVLQHDEATVVADAVADPRFFAGVDRATDMQTRSLLCAPLRSRSGNIGVIEIVNPAPTALTRDDLEFLEALAADIAVAHEKALLYARLRGEVTGLRQTCRLAGLALLGIGVVLASGATLGHLAWALPVRELPTRPGMLVGVGAMGTGAVLLAVARGWLGPTTNQPQPERS